MTAATEYLFGGNRPWRQSDWKSSDDRVRGGRSESFLVCSESDTIGTFCGHLDITALGGAGFASQRTTWEHPRDLSHYCGLAIDLNSIDDWTYTIVLKNHVLPPNPADGREQSTISYEYDHDPWVSGRGPLIYVPWKAFKATYRGKDKPDAPPLDTRNIERMSLMMRSFFGRQHGWFSISFKEIYAVKFEGAVAIAQTVPLATEIHSSIEKPLTESDPLLQGEASRTAVVQHEHRHFDGWARYIRFLLLLPLVEVYQTIRKCFPQSKEASKATRGEKL